MGAGEQSWDGGREEKTKTVKTFLEATFVQHNRTMVRTRSRHAGTLAIGLAVCLVEASPDTLRGMQPSQALHTTLHQKPHQKPPPPPPPALVFSAGFGSDMVVQRGGPAAVYGLVFPPAGSRADFLEAVAVTVVGSGGGGRCEWECRLRNCRAIRSAACTLRELGDRRTPAPCWHTRPSAVEVNWLCGAQQDLSKTAPNSLPQRPFAPSLLFWGWHPIAIRLPCVAPRRRRR